MENPESQLIRNPAKAEFAANRAVFRKTRLFMTLHRSFFLPPFYYWNRSSNLNAAWLCG
jgi:hypothetical protein